MPFTFTNYAGLPVQGDPFARNLVSSLVEGFQAGQLPFDKMRQARMQEQELLMKQLQAEAMPEQQRLQRALMEAKLEEAGIGLRGREMALQREQELAEMLRGESPRSYQSTDEMPLKMRGRSDMQNISYPEDLSDAEIQAIPELKGVGYFDETPAVKSGKAKVIQEGDPRLARIDEIYKARPDMRDLLAKRGFKMTQSVKQSPETGQVFLETTYPSGKVEVVAQEVGKTESERAFQKGIGQVKAKFYENALNAVSSSESALDNLEYIANVIVKDPAFREVTGPIQSGLAKWTGSDEARQLIGKIGTSTGNIVLDAAKSIRGAFTARDQSLIDSIKPSLKDFPDVFEGKLKAMMMLGDFVKQRNSMIVQLMQEGYPPEKAISIARDRTNFKEVYKNAEDLFMNPQKRRALTNELSKQTSSDIDNEPYIVEGKSYVYKDGRFVPA